MEAINKKYDKLKEILLSYGSVMVAFSGGVDSAFLLAVAKEVLGDKAVAISATSEIFPGWEMKEAKEFCEARGIQQIAVSLKALEIEGIKENPTNRCYLCKKNIFQQFKMEADVLGIQVVVEGSNMDDMGDYRPGMQAIKELGICSPLREAGLYKEEIRKLSKEMGLPTWNKPSYACLASRFVYGEMITPEKLQMVEQAEIFLKELGFGQLRVRLHGKLARIEVLAGDFDRLLEVELRNRIQDKFLELGFEYVTIDLKGYRTGSMNESMGGGTGSF